MDLGKSKTFQSWLKNLPQPKPRSNENTQKSNAPTNKEQSKSQQVQEKKRDSVVDKDLLKGATIIQPSREDKTNREPQLVQIISNEPTENVGEVDGIEPIIINLKNVEIKEKATVSEPILSKIENPAVDLEVIKALQALKENGIELPLSVSHVIQNSKEPELPVVPDNNEIELPPKEPELPVVPDNEIELPPEEPELPVVPDNEIELPSEESIEPIVLTKVSNVSEPISEKSGIVNEEIGSQSMDKETLDNEDECLLKNIENIFLLQQQYTSDVRLRNFFDPFQIGEKYLYVIENPTQVDMLVMQLAQLGLEKVEIIEPFAEDGQGIDLFEMNVDALVECFIDVLADSSLRSRTALTNHLYLLKLMNRYNFSSTMNIFNQPNDFYCNVLTPFKNEYEVMKGNEEISENVLSVIDGIVHWLEQQYRSVNNEGTHGNKKGYKFNTKNLETLMDGLNTLQTNVTLQHLFNNEKSVPLLKTVEDTDVVIVYLNPLYTKKTKYLYDCIGQFIKSYLTYIQYNYRGTQPMNIVTFLKDVEF